MKMQQIRAVAEERGVRAGKLGKIDLVRAVQRAEGHFDCFATAWEGICDQYACLWREDCFELAAQAITPKTATAAVAEETTAKPKEKSKPRKATTEKPAKAATKTKTAKNPKAPVQATKGKTARKKVEDKVVAPAKRKAKTTKTSTD